MLMMKKIIFICFFMIQIDTLKKTMELSIQFLLLQIKQRNIKKYTKFWEETKRQIEMIDDDEPIKYKKDIMKIKFESDGDFSQGKTFNILDLIIVLASVL